ncbi:DUF1189 domain-containing protein [Bacillus pinisoli]|uniref:DUF1189 domain-containing protein n=1 Tax=Bacillus pinisoli TaxID=2901866 RepID=UPI001FF5D8A2|nr:DUF1189 domain-containing protein [Bacillus pinisoli]
MKTKQPFFRKFKNTIIKPSEYPIMVQEGVKRAILYLLLLTLTVGLISAVFHSVSMAVSYNTFLDTLEENVPNFTFENGVLDVEGDEPLIFDDEVGGGTVIIDDTGTYTRDDIDSLLEEYTSVLLVTDRYFVTVEGAEKTEFSYAEFGDLSFDRAMILEFLPYLSWVLVLVGVAIFFWFFISKLVMGLLYALFGMIAAKILKKRYTYGQLYSMGLYGITAPSIIALVASVIGFSLPWLLYVAILMVYYVLAIRSINDVEVEAEEIVE